MCSCLTKQVRIFFKFWWTRVLLVGPLMPLFWTYGDAVQGFKARVDPSLACFLACVQWILKIDHRCDTCDTFFLPPATKLGQGYVFTRVCDSVHRGGGIPACFVGGIPACLAGLQGGGSPGPHPGGKLRGLAGRVSRPTPRRVCIPACVNCREFSSLAQLTNDASRHQF